MIGFDRFVWRLVPLDIVSVQVWECVCVRNGVHLCAEMCVKMCRCAKVVTIFYIRTFDMLSKKINENQFYSMSGPEIL